MISGLKPKRLLYRDGTGQGQRLAEALNPGYIPIDERHTGDLLRFAQEYAKEIIFFDENNNPAGNWEGFLIDDLEVYNRSTEDKKAELRKKWISDILSYMDHPGIFEAYPEKTGRFSRPHLALFISFLQLLGYIKDQLNGFTKKHLEFYYFEVLGLSKKKPLPDTVHVILELADDIHEFLVEKGTLLSAGKDSLGKDLIYKTEKDAVISQAAVQNIKTVFTDKRITGLKDAINDVKDALQQSKGVAEEQFAKLFQLVFGYPRPGDKLPAYKGSDVNLDALYADLTGSDESRKNEAVRYTVQELQLPETDFKIIVETYRNTQAGDADWGRVLSILDRAYKDKIKSGRQRMLRKIREGNTNTGFYRMFAFALGEPDPGDDPAFKSDLPFYNREAGSSDALLLTILYSDLNSSDEGRKKKAVQYIRDELLLSENDFRFIMETYQDSTHNRAAEDDWARVYSLIEAAGRRKRNYRLPSPFIEEWLNIYAVPDALESAFSIYGGEGESSLRFHTFGKGGSAGELKNARPARIGFAVSSPQLVLNEGIRTITLTISFQKNGGSKAVVLPGILSGVAQPFLFFVSNHKEWRNVEASTLAYGNFIAGEPAGKIENAIISSTTITIGGMGKFNQDDKGKLIVWNDGNVYAVESLKDERNIVVSLLGAVINKPDTIAKYEAGAVYFNALQVQLKLKETDPPVNAPGAAGEFINIKSSFPVLAMVLNNSGATGKENKNGNLYQQFKDLKLEKVNVKVSVANLKAIELQNDFSVWNYKKPFEPFGYTPETGYRLYFAHPEISSKQLDSLTVKLAWLNPPERFKDYYANYWKIITTRNDLTAANKEITGNTVFTADLNVMDNSALVPLLDDAPLFSAVNAQDENSIKVTIAEFITRKPPAYNYRRTELGLPDEDVLNWKRYFSLELGKRDFQHSIYPVLLTVQALLGPNAKSNAEPGLTPTQLKELTLNAPYTPKLKSLTIDYTASFEVNVKEGVADKEDSIFHIHAFGSKPLEISRNKDVVKKVWFLPYFENEGELYIGLSGLAVPQNLSLLFQMAEGSADPDTEPSPVYWSYLSNNKWQELKGTHVVSDATNGLLNTGIIEFNIPGDATSNNSLMGDGLYWLRAVVSRNAHAVPDTVGIFVQAVSAEFTDNGNADDHLRNLLPAGSIKEPVERIPEINKITQPYTSSKGKPAETDILFYNRVSERLRHKNRALTMWDYERIVLEQFPEIYKVKCIPGEFSGSPGESGRVDVIVIPDIKGKLPFNPFQPKVPSNTILEIQKYLERRVPAFAVVTVKNPSYMQIKTRFAVKIKEGYNEDFFVGKLEEELKRYLAPWAYNEGADIVLGGKIYPDVIVNFIAERPYVEYVAGMKLFRSEDGIVFTDVRTLGNEEGFVRAERPDIILVSALEHEIDRITERGFEEEDFSGINYMRIGLDFKVG